LKNAEISEEYKYPILLPEQHRFSELLVQRIHWESFHFGVQFTLTKVREKYLIIRGRKLIKKVEGKCVVCRKFNTKTMNQPTAPLPKERLQPDTPFSCVGIDFAGPVMVRGGDIS